MAKSNSSTIERYKKYRGSEVGDLINIVHYDEISRLNGQSCHAIIFTDLDRLNAKQLSLVMQIADELQSKHPDLILLNHPAKVKLRFELLKKAYETGINKFNVFHVSDAWDHIQFPVFLREANEHTGALSPLIHNKKNLKLEILKLRLIGYPGHELMIVEFCNVGDHRGMYHKYGALKFGDRIIARQYDLDYQWGVKSNRSGIYTEEYFDGRINYMRDNPHCEWLRKVFEMAGVEYGRADYSLLNGEPQLWEINLNPSYGGGNNVRKVLMRKRLGRDYERIAGRFQEISEPSHIKIRNSFREFCTGPSLVLDLGNYTQIDQYMKPNRRKDFRRKIHKFEKSGNHIFSPIFQLRNNISTLAAQCILFFK